MGFGVTDGRMQSMPVCRLGRKYQVASLWWQGGEMFPKLERRSASIMATRVMRSYCYCMVRPFFPFVAFLPEANIFSLIQTSHHA